MCWNVISAALEPAGVNHEQLVSQALGQESHLGLSIECCYLRALEVEIKAAIKHLQKKHCGPRTEHIKDQILIMIIVKKNKKHSLVFSHLPFQSVSVTNCLYCCLRIDTTWRMIVLPVSVSNFIPLLIALCLPLIPRTGQTHTHTNTHTQQY